MRIPELNPYTHTQNIDRARAAQRSEHHSHADGSPTAGVSVVILNLDKPELIVPQLESLIQEREAFKAQGLQLEIVVGDTGSSSLEVLDLYNRFSNEVSVERDMEYHFSRCNNIAVKKWATCEHILFLNNDVVFPTGSESVLAMYRYAVSRRSPVVVGPLMFLADGKIQHAGIDFLRTPELESLCFHPYAAKEFKENELPAELSVPAVTGACMMIPRAVFDAAGQFDEDYAAECQDVALCLAAHRLGIPAVLINLGHVKHLENATRPRGHEDWGDRRRFIRQWGRYAECWFT